MPKVRVIDRRPLYVRVGVPGPPGPPIQGAADAILFNTDPPIIPVNEGYIFWDKFTKMMAGKSDIAGTTLNFGLEDWTRVRNETGSLLTDGLAIFGSDVVESPLTGEETFLVVPALAAPGQVAIPGILTSDIPDGGEGWAVTRGEVKSYDTSGFNKLDFLYLSGTVGLEGFLTNVPPSPPNYAIPVAYAKDSAADGHIYVYANNPIALVNATDASVASGDPTGFHAGDAIAIDYDPIARTITYTGMLKYSWRGQVKELTSPWISPAHPDELDKGFYLYSSDGENFIWSETPWGFDDVQQAFAWYGTIDKFAIREPHGLMPWQNHKQEHQTTGTYRESGGDVSGYVLDSTTPADRRPTVSAIRVKDEDSTTTLPSLINSLYSRGYLTGAGIFTFAKASADINDFNGNIPYWNEFVIDTWGQAEVAQNQYVSIWLAAIPVTDDDGSQSYRFVWVQGQSSGTLTNQRGETTEGLNLGNFQELFTEFVFIEQQIIRYQAGSWHLAESIRLTGTRNQQVGAPAGNYLSSVSVQGPELSGTGIATDPIVAKGSYINHGDSGDTIVLDAQAATSQQYTISEEVISFTIINWAAIKDSFELILINAGAFPVAWFAFEITGGGGEATLNLTVAGKDTFLFNTKNGGVAVIGYQTGEDVKI